MIGTLTLAALASNNGVPLNGDQIDANWTAIMEAFNFFLAGLVPQITMTDSPDGRSIVINAGTSILGTSQKPAAPLKPRGQWVTRTKYNEGERYPPRWESLHGALVLLKATGGRSRGRLFAPYPIAGDDAA